MPTEPHWIWTTSEFSVPASAAHIDSTVIFERQFNVASSIIDSRIKIAADFCYISVFVNEKNVMRIEPYCSTQDQDITAVLRLGQNAVRLECRKIHGPSAIAASISITGAKDHSTQWIVSDSSWTGQHRTSEAAPYQRSQVFSLGPVGLGFWGIGRRSSHVNATENYEQWRQAVQSKAVEKFWTVPEFEISVVRTAAPDEDSWVSMAFDDRGRITIAREQRGLLRMTLDASCRRIERTEVINDTLQECRGLLYAHGSLFANANNSKGLYRLSDRDGNDSLEQIELLREFPGGVGHGRNDLALGPDGSIYSIHGDSVNTPNDNIAVRTSPLRDTVLGNSPGQGHVVRTDPQGKSWELLCGGLRNPFGLAVNEFGDWFTYDADAEFDMGTPWYRPTRVVHLVSGGDYGWRAVTGKWPPYFPDHPDNAMPTLDIGKGSPTAVAIPYKASFPAEYRRALLILDWTYGRVLAVHLLPRGAGYRAASEVFLQGRPLNVTDLAVGNDGALYLITGGRKTQSALYRVNYSGPQSSQTELTVHDNHCRQFAEQARNTRLQLEKLHRLANDADLSLVWENLDSHDWTLRHAARVALEHQPWAAWSQNALAEKRTMAALESLAALARTGKPELTEQIVQRLLSLDTRRLDFSQSWNMINCYGLLLNSLGNGQLPSGEQVSRQVESIFSSQLVDVPAFGRCGTSRQLQGECAAMLARLGSSQIPAVAVQALLIHPEQEAKLFGLLATRNVMSGWTLDTRRQFFDTLNGSDRFVRGEGMQKFVNQIRADAVATLSQNEKRALAEFLEPRASSVQPLPVQTRAIVKNWKLDDLLPHLSNNSYKPQAKLGQTVFRDALCGHCHRKGATGAAVGPDLTMIANRFSKLDILRSIVEPSAVIAENYRKLQFVMDDGRVIVGRVVVEGDYRAESLHVSTDSLNPNSVQVIDKRHVQTTTESTVSPMPQGLIDSFQPTEILDLLEYMVSASE